MKRFVIYVFVALTFIAGSCKKDSNDDDTPAATTKMSCKVGGTAWNSSIRITQKVDNKFFITGTSMDGKIITITIIGDTPKTYNLATGQVEFAATYSTSATATDIYTAISGTVVLTKVDATNKKISGTFQFSALKASDLLNPLSVTEGVFNELGYN